MITGQPGGPGCPVVLHQLIIALGITPPTSGSVPVDCGDNLGQYVNTKSTNYEFLNKAETDESVLENVLKPKEMTLLFRTLKSKSKILGLEIFHPLMCG